MIYKQVPTHPQTTTDNNPHQSINPLKQVKVEYGSEIDTGVHGSAFPVPPVLLKGGTKAPNNNKAIVATTTSLVGLPPAGNGWKKATATTTTAGGTAAAALGPNGTTSGSSKKAERERLKAYERSGWNINNLPVATGSMLHHLDVPVTGVCMCMCMCFGCG